MAPHQRRLCGTGTHMSFSPLLSLFFSSSVLSLSLSCLASSGAPCPQPRTLHQLMACPASLPFLAIATALQLLVSLPLPALVVAKQGFGLRTTLLVSPKLYLSSVFLSVADGKAPTCLSSSEPAKLPAWRGASRFAPHRWHARGRARAPAPRVWPMDREARALVPQRSGECG